MSTGNRFEQPPAPQPDERERAELINQQVDRLLAAELSRSAQHAADYVIKHERLLDLNFATEFGQLAEQALEETLGEVLGPEHVADAAIPTDRMRPKAGENPEGRGQADFFILTDPENPGDKKQIAVQMFLHGLTDSRKAKEVCQTEVMAAVAQAYIADLEGVRRIPISMASPDFQLLERAFTAWQEQGRRGSLAEMLSPAEKERLTKSTINQVARFLGFQAKLHKGQPELVALFERAQDQLEVLRERLETRKKTGGHGSKSAPPAGRERSPSATAPG